MIKALIVGLFAVFFFMLPGSASAETSSTMGQPVNQGSTGSEIRHAYQPTVVTETGWTRARVQNVTNMPKHTLVCVEAWNQMNNSRTHLGCLHVDLAAWGSMDNFAREFDAPTSWLTPGKYTIAYNYQAADGSWHAVRSMNLDTLNGNYTR